MTMARRATFALALAALATCAHAEEGLVGYWRFDSEGGTVADLSGSGHAATLTGGAVVTEEGKTALRMDGETQIEVPSAADLNLKRGFSIEARVKLTDLADGRTIVFKDKEYMLRLDWPVETSRLSFFVYSDNQWEPRVSAFKPVAGSWYHLVAVWSGSQSFLWVNGQPFEVTRHGELPPATDNPVQIGSPLGYGAGFVGSVEYVKLYARALTSAEIMRKAYDIPEGTPAAGSASTVFEFGKGPQGWQAKEGASVAADKGGLTVRSAFPRSLIMNTNLAANVDKRDYLSLRMSVDKGSRAYAVFATTWGAGRIPFQTFADGRKHTYVLEPWQWVGWGGNLIALGLVPADAEGATAHVEYVRVTPQVQAEPEACLVGLWTESTLPRAKRAETIIAKIRNDGGPAAKLTVTLTPPEGVALKGAASQKIARLGYQEAKELSWRVVATGPLTGEFRVQVGGAQVATIARTQRLTFSPPLQLPKADYVPEPVPAKTGKYTVWTHYCPLWKQGTHTGWKAIEPWPERKPVLGWYNEGTPAVADWHIKYWLEHGISAAVYCWYRSNLDGPVKQSLGHAIHDGLLKARYLPKIKFGIMWENGCGKGVGSKQDLMDNVLPFWIDNYFGNPSYLKVDGKPVLYVWVPPNVTRDLGGSENVRQTFDEMRATCKARGLGGLYLVGCVGTANKEILGTMAKEGWDASSAYGSGWTPPQEVKTVGSFVCAPYEGFVDQQEKIWKAKNELNLLPDLTAAMMGWDSRPWNETSFFWSDNTPEKFRDLCLRAKAVMDAKPTTGPDKRTAILCCWNEFGEGHYIEPTRGSGFSYLDAIRDVFTDAPKQHTDLAPGDVGLGPYDSWYREARKLAPLAETTSDTLWTGPKLAAWTGAMGLEKVETRGGVLHAVSSTSDPAFGSPALKVRANRFTKVVVEMRVSQSGGAQLFWCTSSTGTSEASSARLTTVADGQFHRYTFAVGKNEYWGGCVTSLRLDPTALEGVTVEIRSIGLE